MALFVAPRGRDTVGRIAAIRDRGYDAVQGERVGVFGFFECVDDRACAAALLGEAERWVRRDGASDQVRPSLARISRALETNAEFRVRSVDLRDSGARSRS